MSFEWFFYVLHLVQFLKKSLFLFFNHPFQFWWVFPICTFNDPLCLYFLVHPSIEQIKGKSFSVFSEFLIFFCELSFGNNFCFLIAGCWSSLIPIPDWYWGSSLDSIFDFLADLSFFFLFLKSFDSGFFFLSWIVFFLYFFFLFVCQYKNQLQFQAVVIKLIRHHYLWTS